jgi:beta-lactam-binding protein with PASTA domain
VSRRRRKRNREEASIEQASVLPPVAAPPAIVPPEATSQDATTAPPQRHRAAGLFFVVGLALAAFATGLLLFNSLVMPRLIHGIGEVQVPNLNNLTLEQAEQSLGPLDLQLSRAGERFDPTVPRGFILSQDPAPGTAVRGRRRVSVVVSLGEEFSSVPALFGESQRSAEQLLRSAGLRIGAITRAPSDEVGDGLVAGSDPGPESVLPQGSPVSLLISTGSGQESFVMPDVIGREIGGVRRQLEAFGFRVVTPSGGQGVGTIVRQRPPPGSRITTATEIAFQASGRMIR